MYVCTVCIFHKERCFIISCSNNQSDQKNKRGISAKTVKTITFLTVKSQSPKMRESQPAIQTKIVHHPGGFFQVCQPIGR
jgi:hypothetical protein